MNERVFDVVLLSVFFTTIIVVNIRLTISIINHDSVLSILWWGTLLVANIVSFVGNLILSCDGWK